MGPITDRATQRTASPCKGEPKLSERHSRSADPGTARVTAITASRSLCLEPCRLHDRTHALVVALEIRLELLGPIA